MAERVRVALIGAGRIGKSHAETLAFRVPGAELVGVADVFPDAAKRVAETVRAPKWTTDALELVHDPEVDAVAIASSTDTHAPLIVAAAEAGKHVFCEKPIALDLEATDRAIAAVARAGILFQIGFQRRFDPAYAKAKELITSGALGTIEHIRDTMRDPGPPPRAYLEVCGGLYRDMTIHNFDCVRWLMGREPREVFAMGSSLVDPMFAELGDVDTSIVSIRFDNDALAVIDNSRRSNFGYDVRTEVFGSKGALLIGQHADTPMLRLDAEGTHTDHVYFFLERFAGAYITELQVWIKAIQAGKAEGPDGRDARAAIALAYAAEASRAERALVDCSRWSAPA